MKILLRYKNKVLQPESSKLPELEANGDGSVYTCDLRLSEVGSRSLPQLRMYWRLMTWLAGNTPEDIEQALGCAPTASVWHEIAKANAHLSSIAFDKLSAAGMCSYLQETEKFIAIKILKNPAITIHDILGV